MLRKSTILTALFYGFYFLADILLAEFLIRIYCIHVEHGMRFMLAFSLSAAALMASLCTLLPKRGGRILSAIISFFLFLLYAVQFVYHYIYGSFLAVTQIGMGGDALTTFGGQALNAIFHCSGFLLILLAPTVLLLILGRFFPKTEPKSRIFTAIVLLVACILIHVLTVGYLPRAGKGPYSPMDLYKTPVKGSNERTFGVLTSFRLECKILLFGKSNREIVLTPETPVSTVTDTPSTTEPLNPVEEPIVYDPHALDVDFAALAEVENRKEVKVLHEYFAAQTPTNENEYTGMFEGKNLIVLCCESFSPYVIDKERTPTLYKMANNGFIFTNFYDTVCDNTSNGEYALNIGLIPDTTLLGRGWTEFYYYNSFTTAQKNALPFCFGNQFRALGYNSYAFHNYYGYYYGRNKTHPNMGYEFLTAGSGLEKTSQCPTSDLSMMEQALDILLKTNENGEITPFHAYFLTFSGHMPYNFSTDTSTPFASNDMALKNKAFVADLPYSTRVKAYIAAQEELEYAMTYLLEKLDAAGQLENTVILLTPDHYPYNLGLKDLGELAGKTLDEEFDQYRGSLLLYCADMEAPIVVDTPCCTLDILPTVSNLFGLSYDSRLMMGVDILAKDVEHIAILADRSFVTDRVIYNSKTGAATYLADDVPDGYLDYWIARVKNKFSVSTEMLYSDYYSIVLP